MFYKVWVTRRTNIQEKLIYIFYDLKKSYFFTLILRSFFPIDILEYEFYNGINLLRPYHRDSKYLEHVLPSGPSHCGQSCAGD